MNGPLKIGLKGTKEEKQVSFLAWERSQEKLFVVIESPSLTFREVVVREGVRVVITDKDK